MRRTISGAGRGALLAALVALASTASAAPPGSDFRRFFDSAVHLYRALDFERSLAQLHLAKAQPHGADEDVQIALYEGILQYELGHVREAGEAFREALSLDLGIDLPVSVSPKIRTTFEAERQKARTLAKRAGLAPSPAPQPAARPAEATPAPAAALAPAAPPVVTRAAPMPTHRKIGLAADAVGVAGLAAGGIFDHLAARAHAEASRQAEAGTDRTAFDRANEDFQERRTAALVGYVAGGVLLVGGLVATFWPEAARPPAAVTVVPTADGLALSVSGTWP